MEALELGNIIVSMIDLKFRPKIMEYGYGIRVMTCYGLICWIRVSREDIIVRFGNNFLNGAFEDSSIIYGELFFDNLLISEISKRCLAMEKEEVWYFKESLK
jgi:hypothetical protein